MDNKIIRFYLYKLNFLYQEESFKTHKSVSEALIKMNKDKEFEISSSSNDTLKFYTEPVFGDEFVYGVISNTQNEMVEDIYDHNSNTTSRFPDDKSPIHSTCFVYFRQYGIIAIQSMQKGKGPGPHQVAEFLSFCTGVRMHVLNIDKPSELKALEMFTNVKYIHLRMASNDAWISKSNERAFGGIFNDADQISGKTIDIKINSGRAKDSFLNKDSIIENVRKLLVGNKDKITKLEIGGIDEESEKLITDLITDRYYIEVKVKKQKRIDFEYFNAMNNKALREFDKIKNYLKGYKEMDNNSYLSSN